MYFFVADTAIFNGKSPKGKLFPTGVSDQPLGRCTLFNSNCAKDWPKEDKEKSRLKTRKKILMIGSLKSKVTLPLQIIVANLVKLTIS
jgi:hypothetical protein